MDSTSSPTEPEKGSKPCSICNRPRNVLIRCQIDATQKWHFVCTGKCWNEVSGGKVDGPGFPHYRYGGMWKNKHAGASAKIKGKAKAGNGGAKAGNGEVERKGKVKVKGSGSRKEGRLGRDGLGEMDDGTAGDGGNEVEEEDDAEEALLEDL
ncbi:hypothetical protein EG327_002103 [Venturia inaequalis]|uniref:Uncharacterized protein n=1 Tax=Venturia inaequalis TaxID=5025 RepID=A0A8H3VLC9_VENIN|nr:hypothetical protein EG327_002103 [Venturia inaequalis]